MRRYGGSGGSAAVANRGLARCKGCLGRMSLFAARCPRCGRAKDRTKNAIIALIGIQVVLLALYMRGGWTWDFGQRTHEMRHVALDEQSAGPPAPMPEAPAGWLYFQTSDSLLGDTTRHARLLSDSNPGISNARDHGTTGVIELRTSPRYGNSILLTTKRAAFDLADEHCEVQAKFDNDDLVSFKAEVTTEGDTDVLVLDDYPGFIAKIVKSHLMVLDAKLGRGTERILRFDVTGLVWG